MIGILLVLMMTSPVNMTLPLFVAIAVAGIIGTARMILGAHQRGDIWLGYIIGILVQLGAYAYMKWRGFIYFLFLILLYVTAIFYW